MSQVEPDIADPILERMIALLRPVLWACTVAGTLYLVAAYTGLIPSPDYPGPAISVVGFGLALAFLERGYPRLGGALATLSLIAGSASGAIHHGGPSYFPPYLPNLLLSIGLGATLLHPGQLVVLLVGELLLTMSLFQLQFAGQLTSADPAAFADRLPAFTVGMLAVTGVFIAIVARALRSSLTQQAVSEARYRALVDSLPDGLITFDPKGHVSGSNPAVAAILGRSRDELQGMHFSELARLDDPDGAIAGFAQSFATGQVGRDLALVPLVLDDGSRRIIETNTVMASDGGQNELRVVLRDVTARVEMAERSQELEVELRQARRLEAIGRLAGGVAHDFNNLLTVILSTTHLLADSELDDDQRDLLDGVRDSAVRGADLTGQLLAYARKQVLEPRSLDLATLVGSAEPLLRRMCREDTSLTVRYPEGPLPVFADPVRLEQALVNLIGNASDAVGDDGKITVELREQRIGEDQVAGLEGGRYAQLSVTDNGVGMDEETVAHAFEPFYSTKGDQGTGLGLATVYGAIKQVGGHLTLTSTPGEGTTIDAFLPITTRPLETAAPQGSETSETALEARTILVVDDDESVLRATTRILMRTQHTVLSANSGQQAQQLADDHDQPLDLLITDVVMPHMNGRDLAAAMLAAQPGLRVLFTSGYNEADVCEQPLDQAAVSYLAKPYRPATLVQRVNELLADHAR